MGRERKFVVEGRAPWVGLLGPQGSEQREGCLGVEGTPSPHLGEIWGVFYGSPGLPCGNFSKVLPTIVLLKNV